MSPGIDVEGSDVRAPDGGEEREVAAGEQRRAGTGEGANRAVEFRVPFGDLADATPDLGEMATVEASEPREATAHVQRVVVEQQRQPTAVRVDAPAVGRARARLQRRQPHPAL